MLSASAAVLLLLTASTTQREPSATTAGMDPVETPAYSMPMADSRQASVQVADPVLVGAGDIASCSTSGDETTAALLDGLPGATVYTTGDNAYPSGTAADYANCYEPGWGRHKARTRPSPGNHEYRTAGAAGYFGYFGAAAGTPDQGYYSYDLGSWHIVVLNSNCTAVGGCGRGSPQEQWLRADLAAHPTDCTLAYWHHPLFSSGKHGNQNAVRPFWEALYAAGADVVLNGHDHSYERFDPQNSVGAADSRGIREFVIGTGGASRYGFGTIRPHSVVRNSDTDGVLALTLQPTGYAWEFIPAPGMPFTDTGSAACVTGAPLPATGNLLVNSGFEADANGDTRPDGWSSNARFTRSTETPPHEGSFVGQHRATDTDTTAYTISQVVKGLAAGSAYSVSGSVNIPVTTDRFTFRLLVSWRNASNSVLSTSVVATYTAGTSGWVPTKTTLLAPAGTTNAQMRMHIKGLDGTLYVDGFDFRPE